MNTGATRTELPAPVGVGFAVLALASLAYGLVTGQLLLGLLVVAVVGLFVYLYFLLHRLVVAVEKIAHKL
ncbi:hypothetical protein [Natronococcus roseus]|uniref:hypothetical protein n=1 Tax=Natronococcus roseus TaxID=1052014 RepID=UPI00374D883D